MKNLSKLLVLSALLASLNGCALPRASAGAGFVYTDVTEGQYVDNNVKGSKKGEACGVNILGIASTGDSTIDAAKRNGYIQNIATIDRSYFSILGVYAKSCALIKGN
jgi:hypothetical protein